MRAILLILFLIKLIGVICCQKVITCKLEIFQEGERVCVFNGVTIGQNDTVTIQTTPRNLDTNTIAGIAFTQSSIYSIPMEIFTRFPNIFVVQAYDQDLREIEADTFRNGKNIRMLELGKNKLIHLHVDSFRGGFLNFY
jgi:hypothetical protein